MSYVSTSLLVGTLAVVLYYLRTHLTQYSFAKRHGCQSSPKRPTRDPIFGIGYRIQDAKAIKELKSLPAGADLHRQYGSTYRESSIFGTSIKTASEENIQTVFGLKAKEWGLQPYRLPGMGPFCGEGLLTTDGAVWERSRSMIKPSFHKSNISDLTLFERSLGQFLARIPRDGSTVNLQDLASTLFADTSTHFIIGESLGILSNKEVPGLPITGESFLKHFQLSLYGSGIRILLGKFRGLAPKSATTEHWQVVHKAIDFFVEKGLHRQSSAEKADRDHRNLLDGVMQQTSDKLEIRNQLLHGLTAALDTTPMLVSNTVFLLSRNPEIWNRLREEVASARKDALTLEETKNFKLLRNVLTESLRLYPVFPRLARDALVDTILPTGGGPKGDKPIFAPAGTRIASDFYTLHRDEAVFGPEPETFNPDRWDSIEPGPWQYVPFGGGMRACLGQQKALGEASCTLIRLAQNFSKIESRDDRDWAGEIQLLARNVHGCNVALIPA